MKVKKLEVGSLETNCYIINSGEETAVIDPGEDAGRIAEKVETGEGNPSLKFVLATHFHWDHVNATDELVERYGADFYLGEKDLDLFRESGEISTEPDRLLGEGDEVKLGDSLFDVRETPGHSPGSITLIEKSEGKLFVGDLLFSTGFGRTDLPGGSKSELEDSLARIVKLDGNWEVYSGHGPVFNLSERLASSPFLTDLKEE